MRNRQKVEIEKCHIVFQCLDQNGDGLVYLLSQQKHISIKELEPIIVHPLHILLNLFHYITIYNSTNCRFITRDELSKIMSPYGFADETSTDQIIDDVDIDKVLNHHSSLLSSYLYWLFFITIFLLFGLSSQM